MAFAVLLWLGRHGSFFEDEWTFINFHGTLETPALWFTPHNEHWSTLPLLAYRLLVSTFGIRTYLPYLGLLLALHLVATSGLFVLLRRIAGPWAALGGCAMFLFLGTAYQNLYWAFQIGFVGSTAAGLWALVVLDPAASVSWRRTAGLTALLLPAVMSSGMGLPFLAAAAARAALRATGRLQALLPIGIVAVAFLAWYVAIGHTGTGALALDPFDLGRFVAVGTVSTVRALFRLPGVAPALATGVILVATVYLAVRRRLDPLAVSAGVGLTTMLALVGVGRAAGGDAAATQSRYLYESAAFVLVGLAALLSGFAVPATGTTPDIGAGSSLTSPNARGRTALVWPIASIALVIIVVALGLARNLPLLGPGAGFFREAAGEMRATVAFLDQYGPGMPYAPPPPTRWPIPSPRFIREDIAAFGSPAHDILLASDVATPTPVERDRALWRLVGGTLEPVPGGSPSTGSPPPTVRSVVQAIVSPAGSCLSVQPSAAGSAAAAQPPTVDIDVADGGALVITSTAGGPASIGLGRDAPPDSLDLLAVTLPAGTAVTVHAPRLGDGSSFEIRLVLPAASGAATVCASAG